MRILRVAQKHYPEYPGGGTYHVHAMSRDQASMGHDVTVLTVSEDDSLPRREERDGYTVVRSPPTAEVLGNTLSIGLARELRKATDYDVVHAHSHLYFSTNFAAAASQVSETPLAITNHGIFSQSVPKWVFAPYLRSVGRLTFNSASVVFTYTDAERCQLREYGVTANIEVVSNGIDTTRFTPEGDAMGLANDGPVLLFVGRLVEGKRPADAILSFAEVHKECPSASLYVAGNGSLESSLRELAQTCDIEDSVHFLGRVPYEAMPELYRAADVFLLTSRNEGVPRTVLEALASGVPAVTTDLPQLRSFVPDAGHTVEVGDIGGFVNAVSDLLADDAHCRRLGERGRTLVTKRFTWKDTVDQTTDRLQRCVNHL